MYTPTAERERRQHETATVTLKLTVSFHKACCHDWPDWLWIKAVNENGKVYDSARHLVLPRVFLDLNNR
jgi:hypothetical protein